MKQAVFKKEKVLLIVILAIILFSRIIISVINYHNSLFIQQDNYTGYVHAVLNGTLASSFPDYERRLFPGLPVFIYIVSLITQQPLITGIAISIAASLTVALLLWKLNKSPLPALLCSVFPPVWIKQGAKVATEPIFAAIALLAAYLLTKRKYILAGVFIGFSCTIRPIGIVLLCSTFVLMIKKQKKDLIRVIMGFLIPVILLFLFNYLMFGPKEIFEQFMHGERYGGFRIGFIQIAQDFYRTLDWKQYRIFFSGLFYVGINLFALGMLYKKRHQSFLTNFSFLWMLFSLLFILTPSPFTLLDDFGRYSLASLPPLLIGLSIPIDKNAGEQETLGKI